MEEISGRVLPQGFGYEWTGMSFQEEKSHGQAAIAVGLAILLVYLILAALYANWILPLGVLLVIPLALFGTVAAIMLRGMDNNIYVQIGMLLLIAMSSKNALILVLYARRYGEQGMTAMQAAHKAASVRFRPILMSSLAYAVGRPAHALGHGSGRDQPAISGDGRFRRHGGDGVAHRAVRPVFLCGVHGAFPANWAANGRPNRSKPEAGPHPEASPEILGKALPLCSARREPCAGKGSTLDLSRVSFDRKAANGTA